MKEKKNKDKDEVKLVTCNTADENFKPNTIASMLILLLTAAQVM